MKDYILISTDDPTTVNNIVLLLKEVFNGDNSKFEDGVGMRNLTLNSEGFAYSNALILQHVIDQYLSLNENQKYDHDIEKRTRLLIVEASKCLIKPVSFEELKELLK